LIQPDVAKPRNRLLLLSTATILYWASMYIYVPILSPYLEDRGLSVGLIGFILGCHAPKKTFHAGRFTGRRGKLRLVSAARHLGRPALRAAACRPLRLGLGAVFRPIRILLSELTYQPSDGYAQFSDHFRPVGGDAGKRLAVESGRV
jgi:hypothetical protein